MESILKSILIPYIATGPYIEFLPGFLETLNNFCPGKRKILCVATDATRSKVEWMIEHAQSKGVRVAWHEQSYMHILHQPWPLVALSKFLIWEQFIQRYPKCKYTFMFDSSVQFKKEIPSEIYCCDKMIGTLFYGWDHPEVNHNQDMLNGTLPDSYGYTNCKEYPYVCSGTMGGTLVDVSRMCSTINDWIRLDLVNHVIPKHDDESYFVRYFTELPDEDKLVLPVEFDAAPDYDWFEPEFNKELEGSAYIYSQNDDVIQQKKFNPVGDKPELPYHLPPIPDREKLSSIEYMSRLKQNYKL